MFFGRANVVLVSLLSIILVKDSNISISFFFLTLIILLLLFRKYIKRDILLLVIISVGLMTLRYQYQPKGSNNYLKIYTKSSSNNHYSYKTSGPSIVSSYYLEPGWKIKIIGGNIGSNGYLYYPKLEIIDRSTDLAYKIRSRIIQDIARVSRGNGQALFGGVLLGDTDGFDIKYKQSLNILGLSHIISVSGYNLTVIAAWLRKRYSHLQWQSWRVLNIIIAIWLFVALSGAGSAVLRAAFMLTIFLILDFYHIKLDILELFLISSSTMLIINPLFLRDISWQLSSGATLGIILFTNNINLYLNKLMPKNRAIHAVNNNVSITVGANIITMLIVAIYFHSFSTLTIISNVLIVPLIPIIMIIGIFAFLGAQISIGITSLILLPILGLIDIILSKLEWLSSLGLAKISFNNSNIKVFITLWTLLILAILVRFIHRKRNNLYTSKHQTSSDLIFKMR